LAIVGSSFDISRGIHTSTTKVLSRVIAYTLSKMLLNSSDKCDADSCHSLSDVNSSYCNKHSYDTNYGKYNPTNVADYSSVLEHEYGVVYGFGTDGDYGILCEECEGFHECHLGETQYDMNTDDWVILYQYLLLKLQEECDHR
jgi:hypothetical protein